MVPGQPTWLCRMHGRRSEGRTLILPVLQETSESGSGTSARKAQKGPHCTLVLGVNIFEL